MAVKIVSGKTRQRVVKLDYKSEKVYSWDADNAYPQRVLDLIMASGTASSCAYLRKKYIKGAGFANPNQAFRYNRLLEGIADDMARFGTFALHIQFNALMEISKISHVPVEFCRIGTDASIAVYDNWDKRNLYEPYSVAKIKRYPPFNPSNMEAEIDEGNIEDHPGQILWIKPEDKQYPIAPCDSVLEDISTDMHIKDFKKKNITTNFMASHLFVHKGKFESQQERQEFIQNLEDYQGADKVGNIMLIEVEDDTQIPELKPFTIQNNDKLWEYTERSVKENIISAFEIPHFLMGIRKSGGIGQSGSEYLEAHALMNENTTDERQTIENAMLQVTGEKFEIIEKPPLELYQEEEEENIQQTALNGAQVTSLLEVASKVKLGELDAEAGLEVIKAAFPTITVEQAMIISGIK